MDLAIAQGLIADCIRHDLVQEVGFTGGEPMLRYNDIVQLGASLDAAGISWGMTTGMGWLGSRSTMHTKADGLLGAGIRSISVSVDGTHGREIKPEKHPLIREFVERMVNGGINVTISVTKENDAEACPIELTDLLDRRNFRMEYHYVAPVGHADGRACHAQVRFDMRDSQCPLKKGFTFSVWPSGDVYPCCSTYTVNKAKALRIGNVRRTPFVDIVAAALNDPYLVTIREVGFAGLILLTPDSPVWTEAFMNGPVQDSCHLCAKVLANPGFQDIRTALAQLPEASATAR